MTFVIAYNTEASFWFARESEAPNAVYLEKGMNNFPTGYTELPVTIQSLCCFLGPVIIP